MLESRNANSDAGRIAELENRIRLRDAQLREAFMQGWLGAIRQGEGEIKYPTEAFNAWVEHLKQIGEL